MESTYSGIEAARACYDRMLDGKRLGMESSMG